MRRSVPASVRLTEAVAHRLSLSMTFLTSIRVGLLATAGCVAATGFGQTLPATPPTSPAPQTAQAEPQQPAQLPAQRAQVDLNGKMLSVTANNSSLNQILREISRVTGMKITGGVTDERVYGDYGPADPSTVLTALLRGTGSNMMIVLDAQQAPQELVLTPRAGGPTPPNPSASRERSEEDLPPQRGQRFPRPDGINNRSNQGPPPPPPVQAVPQSPEIPAPPVAPANDTTTQQSPNGVKTPQEIYDQLMKMQQQQQQPKPQ